MAGTADSRVTPGMHRNVSTVPLRPTAAPQDSSGATGTAPPWVRRWHSRRGAGVWVGRAPCGRNRTHSWPQRLRPRALRGSPSQGLCALRVLIALTLLERARPWGPGCEPPLLRTRGYTAGPGLLKTTMRLPPELRGQTLRTPGPPEAIEPSPSYPPQRNGKPSPRQALLNVKAEPCVTPSAPRCLPEA